MNKKYTHIFFDLDNTIWDFRTNSQLALLETFRQLGLDRSGVVFDSFRRDYNLNNDRLWENYRQKLVSKKELIRQRFQLTFDMHEIVGIDPEAMNDLYLSLMPLQTHLNEGARELLAYLHTKRYHLFIITNGFAEVQHKKLQHSGLEHYFERVFISEELKTPKPDRAIFEHAITAANAKKSKSLMVGDDWEVDIVGAMNVQMDAFHFSKDNTRRTPSDVDKKYQKHFIQSGDLKSLQQLL